MADALPETVTIGEAAELLGVHRNTVRNRIKAGHYTAHKVLTPQGETYVIERESLGGTPDNRLHNPSQTTVHHNAHNPYQGAEIADIGPQAQSLALVQRLLAPFVEELGATKLELGWTQVERDHERAGRLAVERERNELAQRLESDRVLTDQIVVSLESERDILKAELDHIRAAFDVDAHRELLTAGDIRNDPGEDAAVRPSDRPGREQADQGRETPVHQGSWLSVAWRRLTGWS